MPASALTRKAPEPLEVLPAELKFTIILGIVLLGEVLVGVVTAGAACCRVEGIGVVENIVILGRMEVLGIWVVEGCEVVRPSALKLKAFDSIGSSSIIMSTSVIFLGSIVDVDVLARVVTEGCRVVRVDVSVEFELGIEVVEEEVVDIVVVEVVDTLTGLIVEVIEVNEETRLSLLGSLELLAIKFKSPDFFVSLRSSSST